MYEEQNGILGYRQMTITVNRVHNTHYNIQQEENPQTYADIAFEIGMPEEEVQLHQVYTGSDS
jgi:hypothetical protein